MIPDNDACVRAVAAKDVRFDGVFFTAVVTTKIYCRPSCPVVPPKPQNMRFYAAAAGAQAAGFRACKRCRPDATPGSPQWDLRADLVARAVRLIADGEVDRNGVPGLATRLGYSRRQLERSLIAELGAGPLALARAQRAQTARLLAETTDLRLADVAFAAGFGSVRQFNDTVQQVFALTPTELRERATRRAGARMARGGLAGRIDAGSPAATGSIAVRLPFREPLCADLFGHLVAHAVPGVEEWRDGTYRRTLRLPGGPGIAALRPAPGHIAAILTLTDLRDLAAAVARCRRLLDLDADPVAVDEVLSADEALAPWVRAGTSSAAHDRRARARASRGARPAAGRGGGPYVRGHACGEAGGTGQRSRGRAEPAVPHRGGHRNQRSGGARPGPGRQPHLRRAGSSAR